MAGALDKSQFSSVRPCDDNDDGNNGAMKSPTDRAHTQDKRCGSRERERNKKTGAERRADDPQRARSSRRLAMRTRLGYLPLSGSFLSRRQRKRGAGRTRGGLSQRARQRLDSHLRLCRVPCLSGPLLSLAKKIMSTPCFSLSLPPSW